MIEKCKKNTNWKTEGNRKELQGEGESLEYGFMSASKYSIFSSISHSVCTIWPVVRLMLYVI